MKDRREYIIAKAMELYATNGYNNVSITDLQIALDMGRGTLYYYFKSQDELFQVCMERYFLRPKQHVLQLPDNIMVPDMITAMLDYLNSLQEALKTFDNKNINTTNVVNLMFTAYNRFPTLYRKANRLYLTEIELWRKALRNSMRASLVRTDIDVELLALMFTHIKDGYDSGRSGLSMDFSIFPRQYNYLYELISVPHQ
ncbi:MAG: TetR/AcrR family transcriptional regulator [Paludibacteraceae bacterium]